MRARIGAGAGGLPATGSSHTTTPEKSCFLRTEASLESRNSILPVTSAARAGVSQAVASNISAPLKQIGNRQVIVRENASSGIQVSGSNLRSFEAGQDIGAEAIDHISGVRLILGDAALHQFVVAIVLLAA